MKAMRQRNEGSALFTVMIVIMTLAIVMSSVAMVASTRAKMATRLRDIAKAQAYAEAGAQEAYTILRTNWSARNDPNAFPAKNYGDGRYDATVTMASTSTAVIVSTGWCGVASSSAALDAHNYGGTDTNGTGVTWVLSCDTNAFKYSMVCGSTLDIGGCSTVKSRKLHSNGELKIGSNAKMGTNLLITSSTKISFGNKNAKVWGQLTAPLFDLKGGAVTGRVYTAAVANVSVPAMPWDYYRQWAMDHGSYYSNPAGTNVTWVIDKSTNFAGGLAWFEGNVTISGGVTTGSVFASQSIMDEGANTAVLAGPSRLGLVSIFGNIHVTSGSSSGIVFAARGEYRQSGNGYVKGQVIAAGLINKTGCSTADDITDSFPLPPDGGAWNVGSSNSPPYVGISAYNK